jgi:ssDNA-specific exonuclease RecJ
MRLLYTMIFHTFLELYQTLKQNQETNIRINLALSVIKQLNIPDRTTRNSADIAPDLEEFANDILVGKYPERYYFMIFKEFIQKGLYTREDFAYMKAHLKLLKMKRKSPQIDTKEAVVVEINT